MRKTLAFTLIILFLGFQVLAACTNNDKTQKQTYKSPELKIGDKATCPVMNSKFTVSKDSLYVVVQGKKYYVCCADCVKLLKQHPDKYLKK